MINKIISHVQYNGIEQNLRKGKFLEINVPNESVVDILKLCDFLPQKMQTLFNEKWTSTPISSKSVQRFKRSEKWQITYSTNEVPTELTI